MLQYRTQLLILFVLLSACAAFWAYTRLDSLHHKALAAEGDLVSVHRNLADMANPSGRGPGVVVGRLDSAELSRRLNSAAIIAGVKDNLVDIDPSAPARLGNSEYNELPVLLRFEKISLQQLTIFFEQLAANDPGSRAKTIELAPPEASPSLAPRAIVPANPDGSELWTADIAVAYLIYAPKETKTR